jgi:hypothetical protein
MAVRQQDHSSSLLSFYLAANPLSASRLHLIVRVFQLVDVYTSSLLGQISGFEKVTTTTYLNNGHCFGQLQTIGLELVAILACFF